MVELYKTPPEKYYEACITYNLIEYFKLVHNRCIYPFSITQVREKNLGFDFGYEVFKGNVFLIQFKRPLGRGTRGYFWDIEKEQLETLAKMPLRSFYALPAFSQCGDWYEGLNKTDFVSTQHLCNWIGNKSTKTKHRLYQKDRIVSTAMPNGFDPLKKDLNNALRLESQVILDNYDELIKDIQIIEHLETCVYWIGGDTQ